MTPSRKPILILAAFLLLLTALYFAFNQGAGKGTGMQASSSSSPSASGSTSSADSSRPSSPSAPWSTLPATNPSDIHAAARTHGWGRIRNPPR